MNFWKDESGHALAEFSLLQAVVSAVIIGLLILFGSHIETAYLKITTYLSQPDSLIGPDGHD